MSTGQHDNCNKSTSDHIAHAQVIPQQQPEHHEPQADTRDATHAHGRSPKTATTYREVGRGRVVPRAEPAAPAPLQDEGSTDEVAVGQTGGNGDDDGMTDGKIM